MLYFNSWNITFQVFRKNSKLNTWGVGLEISPRLDLHCPSHHSVQLLLLSLVSVFGSIWARIFDQVYSFFSASSHIINPPNAKVNWIRISYPSVQVSWAKCKCSDLAVFWLKPGRKKKNGFSCQFFETRICFPSP